MKKEPWSDNVILVDADYVDKVTFNLIVNFERMIGRRIPPADMARWLECVALDGGLRPLAKAVDGGTPQEKRMIQVVLLHGSDEMRYFQPSRFSDLDGTAFNGELGEFLLSSVPVEEMVTMDSLFLDSVEVLSSAEEVRHLILIPDTERIYNKVCSTLRTVSPEKHVTLLTMQPMGGGPFREDILGYSLMAALGIRSEELNRVP